jgi:endonuclease YncB( thermonuclease family)
MAIAQRTLPAVLAAGFTLLGLVAPRVAEAEGVNGVIDGDTIEIASGEQVRLIGIDAPEAGTCEAAAAAGRLTELVDGADGIGLAPGAQDDRDRYERLLRYVHVVGDIITELPGQEMDALAATGVLNPADGTVDAGAVLILEGYAIARYDSRDGYGRHQREDAYVALDEASPSFTCTPAQLATFDPAEIQPVLGQTDAVAPAAAPPPAANVYYQNCDAVRAAGAAPITPGDPGWQNKFDRDDDGVGCE